MPWSADPHANPFLVAAPDPDPDRDADPDTAPPVGVRVVLADAGSREPAPSAAAVARPLDAGDAEALLARLAGPAAAAEPPAFLFPPRSMPAPRPGTSTRGVFPGRDAESSAEPPPLAPAGALRVMHTAPHGEVATSSQVTIVFSRPMVPLAELDSAPPAVRLSPPVAGAWRWLDPHTLVFEAAGRLPKSTRYTVEVAAGLEAADGEPLGQAVRWTFSTSPPAVLDVASVDAPGELPVLALVFDQRVDAAAVLPFLRLEVGGRAVPLRLAAAHDPRSAEALRRASLRGRGTDRSALDSARLVVVRPEGRLPPAPAGDDPNVEAVIRTLPGLPSLEGPEHTLAEAEHRFDIPPAFSVVEHGCGRAITCWPGVPWTIRFNAPLGARPDSGTWVRVDPPLPGATIEAWNDHLVVLGMPEAGQTYTVWLDPSVTSWPGDSLGPASPLRFSVGRPPPSVWMPGGGIAMIPAEQPALYPILAEGVDSVDVEVRAVAPDDWPAFDRTLGARDAGFAPAVTPLLEFYRGHAPGRTLYRKVLPVRPVRGGPGEVGLDLEAALDSTGHALVIAEPVTDRPADDSDWDALERMSFSWVERSELQLDVQEDRDALTVYATSATTGQPVGDVPVELFGMADSRAGWRDPLSSGRTNEAGLAVLGAELDARGGDWVLRARLGGRTVLFPALLVGDWPDPRAWVPHLRRHFLTDRPIYQPGDTVRFAGWLRTAAGVGREPARPDALSFVEYEVHGPRGAALAQGEIFEMGPNGRIEGSFVLPAEVNAGVGAIRLTLTALEERRLYSLVRFQIEEVRRPNFDVSVEVEPGQPLMPGESTEATVRARYFTGGGVPGADVRWAVGSGVADYSPPGITDYRFGRWVRGSSTVPPAEHAARTDGAGDHRIDARIASVHPDVPMNLTVEATVTDLDRQERTARADVLVHPANVYVGLRAPAPFVRAGEPLAIEALVVDLDGRAVADRPITVHAMRQDRPTETGRLVIGESDRARCEIRSRAEPVHCELTGLPAGDYVVVARVEDDAGRHSASELAVRIAGETIPSGARSAQPGVTVEPDRAEYEPGDTALIAIDASFPATETLLTVRRGGVIEARALKLEDGETVVRLPIRDAHVPNVHLVAAAHAGDGTSARGSASVRVAPRTRELDVNVEPDQAEVAPGAATTIAVTVTDAAGEPVAGADVVLSGIDEALAALSHRPFTDPLEEIYGRSGPGVFDRTLRTHVAPRLTPSQPLAATDTAGDTGTIEGVVIAAGTGAPIGAAWVEAPGVGGTWTRRDGSYQLRGVPAGEHLVVARADHYVARKVRGVTLGRGRSARAYFVLLTRHDVLAGGRSLTGEPLAYAAGGPGGALLSASAHVVGEGGLALNAITVAATRFSPDVAAATAPGEGARYRRRFATPPGSGDILRRDLSPVAAFVTRAVTGPDGRVEIPVEMPDNLTRYRVRAVAAKGDRLFGADESTVTVRRALTVRATPPRFLNQGDRFELPVLLENRSGDTLEVDVAVRAVNADVGAPAGRRVVVPSEDRVELRFPAIAGLPGAARFQVAAEPSDRRSEPQAGADRVRGALPLPPAGGGRQGGGRPAAPASIGDAVEVEIPVFVPAVTETFAAYGELDDATPVGYPVRLPEASLPGQARVELGFSTTAAHGLRDALWFLVDCPYELPEVWASRILALTALRDVPAAAPWPRAEIDSASVANVRRLARLQLRDGGWSVWTARFDADPFVTVHAANALARASAAGLAVPEWTLAEATRWLERLDPLPRDSRDVGARSPFPADYPRQARHAVQAYALDVRRRLGDHVAASATALLREAGSRGLTAEALAWLLPALADPAHTAEAAELRRELDARIVRSAGTAGIVSPYDAGGRTVFYSPRRTDAVVLDALLEADASAQRGDARRAAADHAEELVAALARGLTAHRVRGRWSNTQENAFAVAALARYLASAEADEPALRVHAWAGRRLAGKHAFQGRSDQRHEIVIPADSLGRPGEDLDLVIAREGTGRLYYRVGLSYALAGATPAVARGFEVSRVYEAIDDTADIRRDDDGTWRVRRGARVRVRLTVAAPGPRHHVAVIDPLPAGLEAINPALAGTAGTFAPRGTAAYGPAPAAIENAAFRPEHLNVRADRFEAFTSRLEPGRREIVYYALATTPGDFAAPAPRAEEMYAPETFGRGVAERLVVETSAETSPARP